MNLCIKSILKYFEIKKPQKCVNEMHIFAVIFLLKSLQMNFLKKIVITGEKWYNEMIEKRGECVL